ncbi:putative membrane protein [Sphingobium boeckii]|uniref:Putative membrane protein n=2 Tax=Sphingobium boeckii TaxID=1082345 RepID=A0A7W9EFL4_9SPHN|nr:putative membrane protein [Sphingobium boeckii]
MVARPANQTDPRMFLLTIAVIALFVMLLRLAARVTLLERQLAARDDADVAVLPIPESPAVTIADSALPVVTPARIVRRAAHIAAPSVETITAPPPEPVSEIPLPAEEPAPIRPARSQSGGLENLIGGKLPIWIGGVALILSAFFLVRFSIESGLLGPGVRSIIGALFGLALLAGSEVTRRLNATRDDPRVAQALAGAGIASLYGTLYMAAELYGLVGAGSAFVAMIAITLAALGLSLRHGPPTAIMGLLGGFLAPFVTGIDPHSIAPLLVYLALFTAGLFALAIHRGWMWLALAATGGGLAWPLVLMALAAPEELQWLGLFVIVLAFAATLALPKAGTQRTPVRLAPLVVGLIQLVLLAPQLQFSPLAWGLYGLLAAAALFLAWRDPRLTPGAGAALCLMLVLLVIAFLNADPANAPLAALGFTLLFGVAGHTLARRRPDQRQWTAIALGATATPLILTYALGTDLPGDGVRFILAALAAAACASLSWRYRDMADVGELEEVPTPSPSRKSGKGGEALDQTPLPASREGLGVGTSTFPINLTAILGLATSAATAALLAIIAIAQVAAPDWFAAVLLASAAALAAWSRTTGDRWTARAALIPTPLAVLGYYGLRATAYAESVFGGGAIPAIKIVLQFGLLPAIFLGLAAWCLRGRHAQPFIHWAAWLLAISVPLAIIPAPWHAIALALIATACAAPAAPRLLPKNGALASIIAAFIAMLPALAPMAALLLRSLIGETVPYPFIPPIFTLLREAGAPAAILAGLFWMRPALIDPRARPPILLATGVALTAMLYALAKQPLAIATNAQFLSLGLLERALITQALFAAGWAALARIPRLKPAGYVLIGLALFRFLWFDLLFLSPLLIAQQVGSLPILNLAVIHTGLAALWLRLSVPHIARAQIAKLAHGAALLLVILATLGAVRQLTHGTLINGFTIHTGENYLYSAILLGLALLWLARGLMTGTRGIRLAGLGLLTAVTLKVFLVDAAALEGILRILSFLGLGLALIAIGWAYGKFMKPAEAAAETEAKIDMGANP